MQFFVRDPYTMIAAPVQGDVDGIPKRSHYCKSIADGVASKVNSLRARLSKIERRVRDGGVDQTPIVARELIEEREFVNNRAARARQSYVNWGRVFIRAGLYSTCRSDLSSSIKLAAV